VCANLVVKLKFLLKILPLGRIATHQERKQQQHTEKD
jgi:hypothetical protein